MIIGDMPQVSRHALARLSVEWLNEPRGWTREKVDNAVDRTGRVTQCKLTEYKETIMDRTPCVK